VEIAEKIYTVEKLADWRITGQSLDAFVNKTKW